LLLLHAIFAIVPLAQATDPAAAACQRKIDEIKYDRAKPGSVYTFTPREVTAWARQEIRKEVPEGVREPSAVFGTNEGTGSAIVDFLKMQHAKGAKPGWLMERLISGERPVQVNVEIKSGGGYATVSLRSVRISGIGASGTVLEYLIQTFFKPLYPEAHINEAFEMGHNVDRVEVRPEMAKVYIKGAAAAPPKPKK
jgi:hypothetical protein